MVELNGEKINIAIDGPSGSGKGVTALKLAELLGYNYLDTGSMYRAIALFMKENNIDEKLFLKDNGNILDRINLGFNEDNLVLLNGEIVEDKIRTPEISKLASDFSKLSEIRKFLVEKQREIVKEKGFIAEGRDIGSVVIPNAELKIFLTADVEVRAKRRLNDFLEKGFDYTFEEVLKQLEERDFQDMNREESPLIKVKDAILIDNTKMTIDEQVTEIYNLAKERIEGINKFCESENIRKN